MKTNCLQSLFVKSFASLSLVLTLSACVHKVENDQPGAKDGTIYQYDGSHTVLTWTAYKFTSKAAVTGTFPDIRVTNTAPNTTAAATLQNAHFTVFEETMMSNCMLRDSNIYNRFLRKFEVPANISGQVVAVSGTNDTGNMKVLLTINGVTDSVNMAYSLKATTLTAKTSVDLSRFNTQNAFDSLAVTCGKFHAGTDGISKVWSTVDISVQTVFNIAK